MAESLGITTVWTTKAHGQNRDKTKCFGKNLSSNELLRDNIWMINATIVGRKTTGIVAFCNTKND